MTLAEERRAEMRQRSLERSEQALEDMDRGVQQVREDNAARQRAREARDKPFWGDRYTVLRSTTSHGKQVWWAVVDSSRNPNPNMLGSSISFEIKKSDAQKWADTHNDDPTANWNGSGWISAHSNHVHHPLEVCDCQDPGKPYPCPDDYQAPNVCGERVGTYCASHGVHDTCPRSVRAIELLSDPAYTIRERHDLEYRLGTLELEIAAISEQLDKVTEYEGMARFYSA